MSLHDAEQKITRDHAKKLGYVYIRQSTEAGVKKNTAGRERQYEIEKLALGLGWPKENIRIVDQDLARSGSTTEGRYGYIEMLNDVVDGLVGAVFSSEAARVGRDTADWHILIKMCDITGTLVIDENGVYDARDFNDNTMMKFKALMAETELRWIVSRLLGAKRMLAEKGKLRTFTPTGYIYDEDNKLTLDPDEDVQKMVRLVFSLFRRFRSASKIVAYFKEKKLNFPTFVRGTPRKEKHVWKPLTLSRVLVMLHNPVYAGTYVYGRSVTKKKAVRKDGEIPKQVKYQERLRREDWKIVIHDSHPAYITWEQFVENESLLNKNRNVPRGGGPRAGSSFLQGLIRCGKCGQGMRVSYPKDSQRPTYTCIYKRVQFAGKLCQSMPGDLIDRAVEQAFLDALKPAQVEMSLKALGRAEQQALEIDRQWVQRIKRAKAAAAEASDRLFYVDPKNKRAFARVQEDFEQKENEVSLLEREQANRESFTLKNLTQEERETFLALAKDFPRVWQAETTDMVARKNLLRCLIEDVTLTREGKKVSVGIRWKTQSHTALNVDLRPLGALLRLSEPVLERIKKMAPDHTSRQIAAALNDAGMVNGRGQPFTRKGIKRIRERYEIRKHPLDDFRDIDYDGRFSTVAVAQMFGVHRNTVLNWCYNGRLDAVKDKLEQQWWIKITPEQVTELKKTIGHRHYSHPRKAAKPLAGPTIPSPSQHENVLAPKGVAL